MKDVYTYSYMAANLRGWGSESESSHDAIKNAIEKSKLGALELGFLLLFEGHLSAMAKNLNSISQSLGMLADPERQARVLVKRREREGLEADWPKRHKRELMIVRGRFWASGLMRQEMGRDRIGRYTYQAMVSGHPLEEHFSLLGVPPDLDESIDKMTVTDIGIRVLQAFASGPWPDTIFSSAGAKSQAEYEAIKDELPAVAAALLKKEDATDGQISDSR